MKTKISNIAGTTIQLRQLDFGDIEMVRRWRNQDSIRKWFVYSEIITEEQQLKWWEKYSLAENDLMFIIERLDDSFPVGAVALYNITFGDKAEFGRLMIGEPSAQGKGYAVEAAKLLTEYGLSELKLKEIYLEVFKDNAAAYNVYVKSNFTTCGSKNGLILMSQCG
jgi:RimJ/RimL family protein N-acetyltransferase